MLAYNAMKDDMFKKCVLVFNCALLFDHVLSDLIRTPLNTVALSGSPVQLSCVTNLGYDVIEWTVVRTGKVGYHSGPLTCLYIFQITRSQSNGFSKY